MIARHRCLIEESKICIPLPTTPPRIYGAARDVHRRGWSLSVRFNTEALALLVFHKRHVRQKHRPANLVGPDSPFNFGSSAAPVPPPGSFDREDFARTRKLLAEFVIPKSANEVARSPKWRGLFCEPVMTILRRLKARGILVEPNDPRARMCCCRDESDLRMLCLEFGLTPTGSIDQLVDRLLTIDPTGWLLGYAGELLQCSDVAVRTIVAPA